MTITFPQPHVHRPDIKRYALAGVALLATAASFIGIQAAVGNDSPVSLPVTVADATTSSTAHSAAFDPGEHLSAVPAYVGQLERFAQSNGLSGLSPASLAPATHTIPVPDSADTRYHIEAAAIFASSRVPPTSVDTYTQTSFFLAINDAVYDQQATSAAVTRTVPVPDSADTRYRAEGAAIADTGGEVTPKAEISTTTNDDVAWLQANGWLPAIEGATQGQQARSNFGSDIDWLEANGWTEPGATRGDRDLTFFQSINDLEE